MQTTTRPLGTPSPAAPARAARLLALLALPAALASCAAPPLGPMVGVAPGPGRSMAAFNEDQYTCRAAAQGQVAGQAEAANSRAVGGTVLSTVVGAALGAAVGGGRGAAIGAATGAGIGAGLNSGANAAAQYGIQGQYDAVFAQCMAAHGHIVPGYDPGYAYAPAGYAPGYGSDLVRATQVELNRLGYLRGVPDGVAGPLTVSAIRKYEVVNGLPEDGAASPGLLNRMRSTPAY